MDAPGIDDVDGNAGALDPQLDAKLRRLESEIRRHHRLVVAFSGGVDSALLAAVAHRPLGPDNALAVPALSPSLAAAHADAGQALAVAWGVRWCGGVRRNACRAAGGAGGGCGRW